MMERLALEFLDMVSKAHKQGYVITSVEVEDHVEGTFLATACTHDGSPVVALTFPETCDPAELERCLGLMIGLSSAMNEVMGENSQTAEA